LNEVLPGRQHEAEMHGVIDILRPYLMQPANGLLLNSLVAFNTLINTEDLARKLLQDIPQIVEVIEPSVEPPLRREAAKLLRIIAEFVGPEPPFLAGGVPSALVQAVGCRPIDAEFLVQAYGLMSRLANKQQIRVPLFESTDALTILVRSFSNPLLRNVALIFASNIAMDPSHRGKSALLNADILPNMVEYLSSPDPRLRLTVLSLLALLAVPKEGKHDIATDDALPPAILHVIDHDDDESCKKAAIGVRTLVCEYPMGRALFGMGDAPPNQN
jgi:hypothetical protein